MQGNSPRLRTSPAGTVSTWAEAALMVAVTPLQRLLIVRLAVPAGQPTGGECENCGTAVALRGPGRRMLMPAGRCGVCRRRGGAPPYLLELLMVTAAITAVLAAPTWPLRAAALWWVACAVPLVFVDLRVHRLPNALTYPAAAGTVLFLLVEAATSGRWHVALHAAIVAGTTSILFLLAALLLGDRGLGLGDVKLLASIALLLSWSGWGAVLTAVFVAFVAAGAVSVLLLVTGRGRHEHIAMGPFLVAGTLAVLVLRAVTASP